LTSSHPDKDNSHDAVTYNAEKATTQPKVGVPGKSEHRSPSPVESTTNGLMEDAERKRAEERIRFQAKLLDAVGQAAIAIDLEGKVVYWNRAAQEIYGWSEEEVIHQTLSEFVISEELRERSAGIRSELREGKTWLGEFVVQRKDGTTFPAMVTNTPVHDERGNLVGIIGVSADISERKQAEEVLRESEERYRSLVELSPDAILVHSEGKLVYVNTAGAKLLGVALPDELIGKPALDLIHPDYREIARESSASPNPKKTSRAYRGKNRLS
jgi:PAS domain S-box-containing protein